MSKLLDILAATAIITILCILAGGCVTPVALTVQPPTLTIEAPAPNAN